MSLDEVPSPAPPPPDRTWRHQARLQGKVYLVRVFFTLAALALLAVNDTFCGAPAADPPALWAFGLIYPHLGQLLLGRFDLGQRRGHLLFLIDALFVGAVIGALGFALLPAAVLIAICLFNWMVIGGPLLTVFGLALMFAGALGQGLDWPGWPAAGAASCPAVAWLSFGLLIVYLLIVARIVHRLVGALRLQQVAFQTRTDAANTARLMAEQALLAVLPPSAARKMSRHGELPDESLSQATLLWIGLELPEGAALELPALRQFFAVCEPVFARHALELVMSFGAQAIAVGRGRTAPDDAVAAALELTDFFANHPDHLPGRDARLLCVAHRDEVAWGLVRPERLALDLGGAGPASLMALVSHARNELGQSPLLLVSEALFSRLEQQAGFVSIGDPPVYRYAPNQAQ